MSPRSSSITGSPSKEDFLNAIFSASPTLHKLSTLDHPRHNEFITLIFCQKIPRIPLYSSLLSSGDESPMTQYSRSLKFASSRPITFEDAPREQAQIARADCGPENYEISPFPPRRSCNEVHSCSRPFLGLGLFTARRGSI